MIYILAHLDFDSSLFVCLYVTGTLVQLPVLHAAAGRGAEGGLCRLL